MNSGDVEMENTTLLLNASRPGDTLHRNHGVPYLPPIASFLFIAFGVIVISLAVSRLASFVIRRKRGFKTDESGALMGAIRVINPMKVLSETHRSVSLADDVHYSPLNIIDALRSSQTGSLTKTASTEDSKRPPLVRSDAGTIPQYSRRKHLVRQTRVEIDIEKSRISNGICDTPTEGDADNLSLVPNDDTA